MSMILYYSPRSSAGRIQWALEEIGLPYDKVKIDLGAGEQRRPEFLRLNPNGKVPVLVVEGEPMFESLAMLIYLGEKYGVERNLWPELNTLEHRQALMWSTWAVVSLGGQLEYFSMNTSSWVPDEQKHAPAAKAAQKNTERYLDILEEHLGRNSYVLGEYFTLVDVMMSSIVSYAKMLMKLKDYPRINQWISRCMKRDAWLRISSMVS